MDKQRVIEIVAPQATVSHVEQLDETYYTFAKTDLLDAVAQILLEAAKVCNEKSKVFAEEKDEEGFSRFGESIGAYSCKYSLEQLAKELTQ